MLDKPITYLLIYFETKKEDGVFVEKKVWCYIVTREKMVMLGSILGWVCFNLKKNRFLFETQFHFIFINKFSKNPKQTLKMSKVIF